MIMESRTINSKRNIIAGIVNKGITILLPFALRTVIIHQLGAEYLGLGSLYTSILSVLNLTELGFSSAIVFTMYEPVARDDKSTIGALLNFYKKIYRYVGLIILVVGILVTPFLHLLINGTVPADIEIHVLYILYLLDTSISYFLFAHKGALLNAYQRSDVVNRVHIIAYSIRYISQIFVLYLTHNYYLFVIVQVITTACSNLILAYYTQKLFPSIKEAGKVSDVHKKQIKEKVSALFIERIANATRNSIDSITISAFLGLTAVTIYNNYYLILLSVYGLVLIVSQGMQSSVGNSIVSESIEKNYTDYTKFNFLFAWITGWCTICMACLYQDFITVWVGNELLMSRYNMILLCIYFYLLSSTCTRNLYFSGKGLWDKAKHIYISECIGNILLNIVFGKLWGLSGIIWATMITIFFIDIILTNIVLYENYFIKGLKEHYFEYFKYTLSNIFAGIVTYALCGLPCFSGIVSFVIKLVICIIMPNLLLLLIYRKNGVFKMCKPLIRAVVFRHKPVRT